MTIYWLLCLLLIQIAQIYTNYCTAGANPWPFLHWPDSQRQLWKELQQSAQQRAGEGAAAQRKAGGGSLLGNDCHAVSGALDCAAWLCIAIASCLTEQQLVCTQEHFKVHACVSLRLTTHTHSQLTHATFLLPLCVSLSLPRCLLPAVNPSINHFRVR